MATVVLAHLKTQATDDAPTKRQRWELWLTRRLYEQGYEREQVLAVFSFIDWMMRLPAELEAEYWQEVQVLEQERRMPYVTSVERRGIQQGIYASIIEVLQARFGSLLESIKTQLQQISDPELLKQLLRLAATISALDELVLPHE
ncbi:MAG: hypothetical protein NW237_13720 [Cyanobacteriota bacterium]|nr:hypothetical protein [Cyanobacteriota bacterium]